MNLTHLLINNKMTSIQLIAQAVKRDLTKQDLDFTQSNIWEILNDKTSGGSIVDNESLSAEDVELIENLVLNSKSIAA